MINIYEQFGTGTKCLKNQSCDVIKMRKTRGEVGKKPPENKWVFPYFLWRHKADFWDNLCYYAIFTYLWQQIPLCRFNVYYCVGGNTQQSSFFYFSGLITQTNIRILLNLDFKNITLEFWNWKHMFIEKIFWGLSLNFDWLLH